MNPPITIIAAMDRKNAIAKNGNIPWKLPDDMKMFKELTTGYPVIMGRKTWESLPEKFRPLPNRRNVVISRQTDYSAQGAEVCNSLETAIELLKTEKHIFVIGGAEIYAAAAPYAKRLVLTTVDDWFEGDIFFPIAKFPPEIWTTLVILEHQADECHLHPFRVQVSHHRDWPIDTFCLSNSRNLDQLIQMVAITTEGICPFCPEHFHRFHREPIVWENDRWIVTQNDWPYEGASVQLLLIPKRHVFQIGDLPPIELKDLSYICGWAQLHFGLTGYSLFARSGDMSKTGATVAHHHWHLIAGESDHASGEPLKVKVGFQKA